MLQGRRTAGRKLRRIDAFFGHRVKNNRQSGCRPPRSSAKLGHALHHSPPLQARPGSDTARRPLHTHSGGCWRKVVLCQIRRHGCRGPQPVGIQPRFHRKAAPVGLLQKDVQRVKTGVLPLHAGAQVAPRNSWLFVKCIEGLAPAQAPCSAQGPRSFPALHAPGAEGIRRGKSIAAHSR